jgi:hypothetical protein
VFTAQGVHFPAIFRVCVKKFNIYQNQASMGTNAGANFIQKRHLMSKIVVEKSQKFEFSSWYSIFLNKSNK